MWKLMRPCLAFLLLLGTMSVARANDSAVDGQGGSWQPVRGEHPSVRMVRENIRIDIYQKHYDTVANFEFMNMGAATQVKMGFPESAYPNDQPKKSSFLSFSTTVDGNTTPVKRVLTNVNVNGTGTDGKPVIMGFSALWVKEVSFAKGQLRKVQVRYRSEFGDAAVEGPNKFVPYDFTGGNWRGAVEKSTLTVVLHDPGYYLIRTQLPGKPKVSQLPTRFDFTWTNWQAQGPFLFWLAKTLPEWLILPGSIQFYDDTERTDAEVISLLKNVTVPGKASPEIHWAPPILLRNGVLFVNLSNLERTLYNQRVERRTPLDIKSQSTRTTGAIRVGATRLSFWTDQKQMLVEGQGSVSLPAFPFSIDRNFYVPLEPVIKTLGGTLNVNQKARRVYFTLP